MKSVLLGASLLTLAHMPDRSDLNGWFSALKLPGETSTCCSYIDGTAIASEDYFSLSEATPAEIAKCRPSVNRSNEKPGEVNAYCVHLFAQWWFVPERVVLKEPNKYGVAIVFGLWGWEVANGEQRRTVDFFRCFLPGAGT